MPNFNPFSDDAESTSFERGMPVNQAAKNVTQAAKQQADEQVKAANKAIIDQLYGPSDAAPEDPGTDEANPLQHDNSNQAARMAAAQMSSQKSSNSNQSPEEAAKMKKIRAELFSQYSAKFHSAINGAQPLNTNLEMQMDKVRKENEQQEMQKKQEEEEEEQRKKEEEEAQKQELAEPTGKKSGMMYGKKQQEPLALRLAKTKTEINRGATG